MSDAPPVGSGQQSLAPEDRSPVYVAPDGTVTRDAAHAAPGHPDTIGNIALHGGTPSPCAWWNGPFDVVSVPVRNPLGPEQDAARVPPPDEDLFRRVNYTYALPCDERARSAFRLAAERAQSPEAVAASLAIMREHFDQVAYHDHTIHACLEQHRHGALDEVDALKLALLTNAGETARLQRALLASLERERVPMVIAFPKDVPR